MKRTFIILVAFMVVVGIFTLASFADHHKGFQGRGKGGHLPIGRLLDNPEFIEKLELVPDQIASLKTLHFDHQKRMISLRSNLQLKKVELRQLMEAEKLDKGLIRKKVKEITAAKGDMALEKVEMKLSAADILTEEQLAKLKKMKREVRKKRIVKRMGCDEPGERHEKRMRIHKRHPGWHDMPGEEEFEREIIIEEEE
jgi:Spy/CpxP family protein refolding chaperone